MKQIAPLEAGICVADLERMLAFYERALGCREVRRAEIPAVLSQSIALAANGYTCVWLKTPGGETLKLMRPAAAPAASRHRRRRPRLGGRSREPTRAGVTRRTAHSSKS